MPDRTRPGLRSLIVRNAFMVSVAVGMFGAPSLAAAQPPQKVFRVGLLSGGGRTPDGAPPGPLREGLRGLGYVGNLKTAATLGLKIPPSLLFQTGDAVQ